MLFDLHGVILACDSRDPEIALRWAAAFASLPPAQPPADIHFTLRRAAHIPSTPCGEPLFTQGDLLRVYRSASTVTIQFPRFGQLRSDLAASTVEGELVDAALDQYGVLEDVIAMGLTALLRRRGFFLMHAFAAARDGRAVLLVGDIGSGKTTSGISLIRAGWRLLSNDSPMVSAGSSVRILSYPGLLSAYPDTLSRFPELASISNSASISAVGRRKVTFAAETLYPNVWLDTASIGAIIFPRVAYRPKHEVERLGEAESLRRLLPNAIDRWDEDTIPQHLELLRILAASAPAYAIQLGEDTSALPALLASLMNNA